MLVTNSLDFTSMNEFKEHYGHYFEHNKPVIFTQSEYTDIPFILKYINSFPHLISLLANVNKYSGELKASIYNDILSGEVYTHFVYCEIDYFNKKIEFIYFFTMFNWN